MYRAFGKHDQFTVIGYSLREAEEDPNVASSEGEETAENTDSADPNVGGDDTSSDEGTEDSGDSEESPDNTGDESEEGEEPDNGDADFNIDAEDDTGEEESMDDGDDISADPNSDSSVDSEDEEEEDVDEDSIKALDGKLYEDLSPAEQKLKIRHLKKLFVELFYNCGDIGEKLNSIYIDKDTEANLQVKRAGSMIFDLKQMISDYFLNTFDSKSYLENDIMFNRYLAILDQVKGLTEDIKKTYFSDSE